MTNDPELSQSSVWLASHLPSEQSEQTTFRQTMIEQTTLEQTTFNQTTFEQTTFKQIAIERTTFEPNNLHRLPLIKTLELEWRFSKVIYKF